MNYPKMRFVGIMLVYLISSFSFINHLYAQVAPAMQPARPGEVMLSPQELEELQAMEQLVEAERSKMSPAQRADFDSTVSELTKELEKMKPEELDAFISQVIFGQEGPPMRPGEMPPMPGMPQPTVAAPEIKPVVEEIKKPTPSKKREDALNIINAIINYTNSFLTKISIMPEFAGKLKKWAEQGKVKDWKPNYTWDSEIKESAEKPEVIKKHIEGLVQKLSKIKEQDKKTKEYKYLDAFAENEALINNLGKLRDTLQTQEPEVEIEDFGLEPVSKESRKAIRLIISAYLEAFFTLAIPAEIEKVFESFEPLAKQYREQEETRSKQAIEESKRWKWGEPPTVGGTAEDPYGFEPGAAGQQPAYEQPYYGGSPYDSSYGGRSGYPSTFEPGAPGMDARAGYGQPGEQTKQGSSERPISDRTVLEKAKEKSEDEVASDRLISRLENDLDEASAILSKDPGLGKIQEHIQSGGAPNIEVANTDLPNVIRKMKDATDISKRLKVKFQKLTSEQQKSSRTKVKSAYDEYKGSFDNVVQQVKSIRANEASYTPKMKQAFLGKLEVKKAKAPEVKKDGDKEKVAEETPEEARFTPPSLYDLQRSIEDFEGALRDL